MKIAVAIVIDNRNRVRTLSTKNAFPATGIIIDGHDNRVSTVGASNREIKSTHYKRL